jgi:hypothetical protein
LRDLTPEGEKILKALAERHQISVAAVKVMMDAVARGQGSMAQFSHPELGGSGQWLRGGMTMVGDMFNHALKAKVDALCNDLSTILANTAQAGAMFAAPSQSQSQSQHSGGAGQSGFASFSASGGNWWPAELGNPAATGAQNNMRYAYFPAKRRLVLDRGGNIDVLDTGDHQIHGFGQQQGGGDGLTFSTQRGTVSLGSFRRVGGGGSASTTAASTPSQASGGSHGAQGEGSPSDAGSILALVERLAELKEKGVLTDEEFTAKKAELLKRL